MVNKCYSPHDNVGDNVGSKLEKYTEYTHPVVLIKLDVYVVLLAFSLNEGKKNNSALTFLPLQLLPV